MCFALPREGLLRVDHAPHNLNSAPILIHRLVNADILPICLPQPSRLAPLFSTSLSTFPLFVPFVSNEVFESLLRSDGLSALSD